MKRLSLALTLLELLQVAGHAQDTSCGIVWYPPIQISPGISGVDESNPSLAVQGDTVHVTWANSSQKFPYRRSTDAGQSFLQVQELAPDSLDGVGQCFLLTTGSFVYGFWIHFGSVPNKGWMIRSTNHGATWEGPRIIRDSTAFWHFGSAMGDTIALGVLRTGENRRVFRSTNRGDTWSESSTFVIGNDPRVVMTPGSLHRVVGWVFDSAGVWSEFVVQYRKSTDLGDTWSDSVNLSTMSSRAYEPAIAADGSGDSATVLTTWKDVKYGCLTLGFCSILGRRSTTNGNSFEQERRFDLQPRGAFASSSLNGNVAVVAWSDEYMGVYVRVSTDRGLTWCAPYVVAPMGGIQSVAVSGSTVHIAWNELIGGSTGDFRVFYRRGVLLPTSVPEREGEIPSFVTLAQNYPNPFNPTTVIRYSLSVNSYLTLKVYDVLGREVAVLVNETMIAGEHTVQWDAKDLPSGLYFYRLFAGRRVETKKAILLK